MMDADLKVKWIDGKREPKHPASLEHPRGIDVDVSKGVTSCFTLLPYPAKRCGIYVVECARCGYRAAITTAGRADDPRSIKVPCK
jgi:hypothetical protein